MRIGRHAASPTQLDLLQVGRNSFGLTLGQGEAGEPVTVRLLTSAPRRVVLLGGVWMAELVAFRALRAGARVVVFTPDPGGWIDLGRRATGRTDRVAVLAPGDAPTLEGSADFPVLQVSRAGEPTVADLPGWTTRVWWWPPNAVAESQLTSDQVAELGNADLVLSQRLSPHEAARVGPLLRLSPQTCQRLPMLPDGRLAVLTQAGFAQVKIETSATGPGPGTSPDPPEISG